MAAVQFESEFRAKYIARAFKSYQGCLRLTDKYNDHIDGQQPKIQKYITLKIKERTDDLEVLQQIFEVLYEAAPDEMPAIKDFVGQELFEVYFKLAIEVDAATGEKNTALKFFHLCQEQSKRIKGYEDEMVRTKI